MAEAYLPTAILNRPEREEEGLALVSIYETACRERLKAELRHIRNFAIAVAALLVVAIFSVFVSPLLLIAFFVLAIVAAIAGFLMYLALVKKRPSLDFLGKVYWGFEVLPFPPHGYLLADSRKGAEPLDLVFMEKGVIAQALGALEPIKDSLAQEGRFLEGLGGIAEALKSLRREHFPSPFLQGQDPLTLELLKLPPQGKAVESALPFLPSSLPQGAGELAQRLASFLSLAREERDFLSEVRAKLSAAASEAKAVLQGLYPLMPPPAPGSLLPAAAREWIEASFKDRGYEAPTQSISRTIAEHLEREVKEKVDNIRGKSHLRPQEVLREYETKIAEAREKTQARLRELVAQRDDAREKEKQALKKREEWQKVYNENSKVCEQSGDSYFGVNKQLEETEPEMESARLEYKTSTPGTDKETTARRQMVKVFEERETWRDKGNQAKLEAAMARKAMLEAQEEIQRLAQHINSAQFTLAEAEKLYLQTEQEGQEQVKLLEEERDAILEAIRLKEPEGQVRDSLAHIEQLHLQRQDFLKALSALHQEVEGVYKGLDLPSQPPNTYDNRVLALKLRAIDELLQRGATQIDSALKEVDSTLNLLQGYFISAQGDNLEGNYYVPLWCGAYRSSPDSPATLVLLSPSTFEESKGKGRFCRWELKPLETGALYQRLLKVVEDPDLREFLASQSLFSRPEVLSLLWREELPRWQEGRLISKYLARALASFLQKRLAELGAPLPPSGEKVAVSSPEPGPEKS